MRRPRIPCTTKRYDILEGEARGAYAEKEKTSSQTYVLSVGTKTNSSTPFVWFPLSDRERRRTSASSLKASSSRWMRLWPTAMRATTPLSDTVPSGVRRQSCLVHARREAYGTVTSKLFLSELNKLTPQERAERIRAQALAGTTEARMLSILSGCQLLFQYEEGSCGAPRKTRATKARRPHSEAPQKYSAPVFDAMDELYKGLAETLAKEKNGKYVKTIDTAAAGAVVYWMNRQESLEAVPRGRPHPAGNEHRGTKHSPRGNAAEEEPEFHADARRHECCGDMPLGGGNGQAQRH